MIVTSLILVFATTIPGDTADAAPSVSAIPSSHTDNQAEILRLRKARNITFGIGFPSLVVGPITTLVGGIVALTGGLEGNRGQEVAGVVLLFGGLTLAAASVPLIVIGAVKGSKARKLSESQTAFSGRGLPAGAFWSLEFSPTRQVSVVLHW